jgi:hypothetical protein
MAATEDNNLRYLREEFRQLQADLASRPIDNPSEARQDIRMTDLTRPEIDARFKEADAKNVASEARIDARLANFDTSIKTGFAELRVEMAKARADSHKDMLDIIRWMIGTGIALAGTTIAVLAFVINNSKPPSAATGSGQANQHAPQAPPAAASAATQSK